MAEDLYALTRKDVEKLRAHIRRLENIVHELRGQVQRKTPGDWFPQVRDAVLDEELVFEGNAAAHYIADHRGSDPVSVTPSNEAVIGGVYCRKLNSGETLAAGSIVTIALEGVKWQVVSANCPV